MVDFYVYILYPGSLDRYYVGQTGNLEDRLRRHNSGRSKSTKAGVPWELMYVEKYGSRSEAVRRERQIKKWKSRTLIEELIKGAGIGLEHPD